MSVRSAAASVTRQLLDQPQGETALRLTALFFLASSRVLFNWYPPSVFACAMAVLMLVSPDLLRRRAAWAGMLAVLVAGLVARWPVTENNRYLDAYWVLACCLAVGFPREDAERLLARNGRLLVGMTFTLAATQKALRGGYFDGSFLHGLVLWDERFRTVARLFGGLEPKDILANAQLKTAMSVMPSAVDSIAMITSERLRIGALFVGWFVLWLEASIGLSFLLERPRWLARWRHAFLFLFVLPTYLLAQVSHFGMILAVMGFAQCPPEQRGLRVAYLLVFVFLCFADMTGQLLIASTTGS